MEMQIFHKHGWGGGGLTELIIPVFIKEGVVDSLFLDGLFDAIC